MVGGPGDTVAPERSFGFVYIIAIMRVPRTVWNWSIALFGLRIAMFLIIYANQSHDAQWQLSYFPLWIADFPLSLSYGAFPIPEAEAIIGPLWWFLLPLLIWWLFRGRRRASKK